MGIAREFMVNSMIQWLGLQSIPQFYTRTRWVFLWCLAIAMILGTVGIYGGLYIAPPDDQQGDTFRILYVHVPFALGSLGVYTLLTLCAGIFLVWRVRLAAIFAKALAPIGAMLTVLALCTGAIWGKPMWGAWWVWDARLTTELLLLFIYGGYIGLHQAIPYRSAAHRTCALYALIGWINVPIIHFSVYWWHTLHQGTTFFRLRPTIDSQMYWPLLCTLAALGFYVIGLAVMRARALALEEDQGKRWVHQQLRGKL